MKPILKKEDADLLTDKILQKLAQDIPVETITNLNTVEPLKSSWMFRIAATFTLLFLSITAIQESHHSSFSYVDWTEKSGTQLVEMEHEYHPSYTEKTENPQKASHSEIRVAHLEYDQPIEQGPVAFEASETITLKPGFSVKAGVVFSASISSAQSLSLE